MKGIAKDYFGRSKKYGESVKTYRDPELLNLMMEGLEPLPQGDLKALDLACGQGDSSKHLKDAGIEVHYFDITPHMIERGVERGIIPKEFAYVGDMDELGFEDEFFDIIMSRYAFHDVEHQPELLNKIRRILKKQGKAQITDMCSPSTEDPEIKRFYNFYHEWKTGNGPRKCWIPDADEIRKMFIMAGFDNLKEAWYRSKIVTSHWLEEGQVSQNRYNFLNHYISVMAMKHPSIRETFNIREEEGKVKVDFPVIILTGERLEVE